MDGPPAPEREPMAPPHQLPNAPVPPQPQWAYQPAPRPAVRPVWIIAAGIIIAVAVIIAAIIISHGGDNTSSPANAPTSGTASQQPAVPSSVNVAASTTCVAWRSVATAFGAIPDLPPGWDWDTAGIDRDIANHNEAVGKALDIFEPLISDEPADLAKIAHTFVDSRRNEMKQLSAHTFNDASAVPGNVANGQLDQLCGTETK